MAKLKGPEIMVARTFETFHNPVKAIEHMANPSPHCLNQAVNVVKYKVTVEEIPEPLEVIHARLLTLWRRGDNHHDYESLKRVALRYGLELKSEEWRMNR